MSRVLRVWWKKKEMSDSSARKAVCEGGKQYRVTQHVTDFPADLSVEAAQKKLEEEHGKRPEVNPFKGCIVPHAFAEIISYRITEATEEK